MTCAGVQRYASGELASQALRARQPGLQAWCLSGSGGSANHPVTALGERGPDEQELLDDSAYFRPESSRLARQVS
jgi:hypothetical protein